jgi:hypothetical protein
VPGLSVGAADQLSGSAFARGALMPEHPRIVAIAAVVLVTAAPYDFAALIAQNPFPAGLVGEFILAKSDLEHGRISVLMKAT